METSFHILEAKGIRGVNKRVNAVALRQITGWSSRIGISRLAEGKIRELRRKAPIERLNMGEKIAASTVGGAKLLESAIRGMPLLEFHSPLYTELTKLQVLRVEMQSVKADPARPANASMLTTLMFILKESGVGALFRGVVPRIGVASWATICMVG
ncbi:uncharacterized protein A1O9_10701 [Exophiala aquamarina CBS 119918]|uniref:Uncharacterized protein n=1 Tax=Exophiala aquamarina CBS 119918 TaxID=1182545 RepID=A0A072P1V0_9EURO|nr:uncharacterized protein A1O9_10701 [Exophiala aquamarina CBS 119918]KEF53253.1 hypothetical protein A1O9_10701 [Exophiala aquamarina CBS 119918]